MQMIGKCRCGRGYCGEFLKQPKNGKPAWSFEGKWIMMVDMTKLPEAIKPFWHGLPEQCDVCKPQECDASVETLELALAAA